MNPDIPQEVPGRQLAPGQAANAGFQDLHQDDAGPKADQGIKQAAKAIGIGQQVKDDHAGHDSGGKTHKTGQEPGPGLAEGTDHCRAQQGGDSGRQTFKEDHRGHSGFTPLGKPMRPGPGLCRPVPKPRGGA